MVWPPTPLLRKRELQLRVAGVAERLEVVRVQVLGGDAVSGHHPHVAVLERESRLGSAEREGERQGQQRGWQEAAEHDRELRGRDGNGTRGMKHILLSPAEKMPVRARAPGRERRFSSLGARARTTRCGIFHAGFSNHGCGQGPVGDEISRLERRDRRVCRRKKGASVTSLPHWPVAFERE